MPKYRKKPVEIEAMQFTGDNWDEMNKFCGTRGIEGEEWEITVFNPIGTYMLDVKKQFKAELWVEANKAWLGLVEGEWVIKDSLGFYPCKPDIFAATYDAI